MSTFFSSLFLVCIFINEATIDIGRKFMNYLGFLILKMHLVKREKKFAIL